MDLIPRRYLHLGNQIPTILCFSSGYLEEPERVAQDLKALGEEDARTPRNRRWLWEEHFTLQFSSDEQNMEQKHQKLYG